MNNWVEIKVPDIGDFKDVGVIEVLIAEGDTIQPEQSLITVETDKATMEIPAVQGGIVRRLKVKVGDTVSIGTPILDLEPEVKEAAPSSDQPADNHPAASSSAGDAVAASSSAVAGSPATGSPAVSPATGSPVSPATGASTAASSPAVASSSTAVLSSAATSSPTASSSTAASSPNPTTPADIECDMLVLGAGPGGYSAAFRAADLGMKTVLVERYTTLGGVCLNVGCIPSKALLHTAAVMESARALAHHGISFGEPTIDLQKLVGFKDNLIGKLTGGLASMAAMRKVSVVTGVGTFINPHDLSVRAADGTTHTIRFKQAIIAAGSQAIRLPFLPDDPRIVDATGALLLRAIPKKMLIIGGGIIGLEMGTVYAALGARLEVVEQLPGLMPGADRDLVKIWQKYNAPRFDRIMLKTKTVAAEARPDGIYVSFEGPDAPAEPQAYDLVLQAVGRTPNGKQCGAEQAGVTVTERGFIPVDTQMRTNVSHIFAIGDIVGQPMLAHKAVHEGHVAAEVAAGEKAYFDARVIPAVAYTDPELAWVGLTEDAAQQQGIPIKKSIFPWAASGRAMANGRDEGCTKLIFDAQTHRILGGGIVGTQAGDLISEVALAVEMNADIVDIAHTIHPHPTLSESIGMAAEVAHGTCTDLPPARKR
jgi:dihydrolipoamide dehydrogenase